MTTDVVRVEGATLNIIGDVVQAPALLDEVIGYPEYLADDAGPE